MSTKNNPGAYDCYANAAPDEEMFILLSRDRMGPSLVELWADVREGNGEEPAKVAEARSVAERMRAQLTAAGKSEVDVRGFLAG